MFALESDERRLVEQYFRVLDIELGKRLLDGLLAEIQHALGHSTISSHVVGDGKRSPVLAYDRPCAQQHRSTGNVTLIVS
jgi:hypothetical protein